MKREFMVERQGKAFVLYAGLLDEAHGQGLKGISTMLLQIPSPDNGNVAICRAEVTTEKGTFTGIGDASPDNVARIMAPHIIRMAETRAKARALRDAVNVGVAALEELADDDHEPAHHAPQAHAPAQPQAPKPPVQAPAAQPKPQPAEVNPSQRDAVTPMQLRAIYKIAWDQSQLSGPEVDAMCEERYKAIPQNLTKREASDFITALQAKQV